MRSAELGEFLRSRRSRTSPADVGYPNTGRRRAPGLRREEVAAVAGVTVSWLAKLEQGKAQSVSAEVLNALARAALRLDEAECTHLFALGGLRLERHDAPVPRVTSSLRDLLDALDPNPAYLLDGAWNITAWNSAEVALFPGLLSYTDAAPNLLDIVFHNDGLQSLMIDHDQETVRLVSQFRVHCTDWPDVPELLDLVRRLNATSPSFARLWTANDVAPFVTTRREFDHPVAGRLEFDHHRLALLDQLGAQLVVYVSAPGSDSAARLRAVT